MPVRSEPIRQGVVIETMKLDPVVKKENLYMILGSAVCTAVVQLVFWAVDFWDSTVFFGGLWGFFITVLNFFIMTVAIQKAMASGDEQQAKMKLQASYTGRMLLLIALMIVGIVVPFLHWAPVILSVFFPRVVITVRGVITSIRNRGKEEVVSNPVPYEEDDEEREDGFEKMVGRFGAKAASGIISMEHGEDKMEETTEVAADTAADSSANDSTADSQ